jgi:hypothetical protein
VSGACAAVLGLVACTGGRAEVDVFGFNFSPRSWTGHDVALEAAIVGQLASAGLLKLHPTGCQVGKRPCSCLSVCLSVCLSASDGVPGGNVSSRRSRTQEAKSAACQRVFGRAQRRPMQLSVCLQGVRTCSGPREDRHGYKVGFSHLPHTETGSASRRRRSRKRQHAGV